MLSSSIGQTNKFNGRKYRSREMLFLAPQIASWVNFTTEFWYKTGPSNQHSTRSNVCVGSPTGGAPSSDSRGRSDVALS